MRIINLLPKSKQQELRHEIIFHSLLKFCALSAVTFVFVFLSLFATRVYIQREASQIDKQIEQVNTFADKQENAQLKNQVRGVNNVINDFQTLADTTPRVSKALSAFVRLVPQGVKIQSFEADLKKKEVKISGFSPRREEVIALYNNISKDANNFFNIDYPLDNVSKPENITFHYTFSIKDELLK